jgi:hypothetical protein
MKNQIVRKKITNLFSNKITDLALIFGGSTGLLVTSSTFDNEVIELTNSAGTLGTTGTYNNEIIEH